MSASCGGCSTCGVGLDALKRMGLDLSKCDFVVALAGNPNTGKSTVFNALTGLRQHTGNWPGKTVTRAEGGFQFGGHSYKLVDLPGTYSLLARSTDEEIARNFLLFGRPHVAVVVADATRLERNLNFALQVLEITDRVVICLNLMDEARRHGLEINHKRLARDLGVPVVPAAARQREGLNDLLQAISEVATEKFVCAPHRIQNEPPELKESISKMTASIKSVYPDLPNARWVALRLLDGDDRVIEAVRSGELGDFARVHELEPAGVS